MSAKSKSELATFFTPGRTVFIRTVTHHHTGRVVRCCDKEVVLEDAAWIAYDGRFADFLKSGVPAECEPFPDGEVLVNAWSIIDACDWPHPLPRTQV